MGFRFQEFIEYLDWNCHYSYIFLSIRKECAEMKESSTNKILSIPLN